jgi:uncharacterized protein (DUF952 family)
MEDSTMSQANRYIYHITTKSGWQQARLIQAYMADSLNTQGFIHCSTKEQILGTANAYFRGKKDLVILCIETDRVQAPIKYEHPEGDPRLFPHIYGPLNIKAVLYTVDFPPEPDGSFKLPNELK